MFHTDEMAVKQRMEDIRSEVEAGRWKNRGKAGKPNRKPFWIVLVTFFRN